MRFIVILSVMLLCSVVRGAGEQPASAPDLNPVTLLPPPTHEPIVLVENGQARATLCLMGDVDPMAVAELQKCLKLATGSELPVSQNTIREPALILGDCADATQAGLVGAKLPVEGFAIKTAPNRIHVVGNGAGSSWGIYEFLERFVGARWYFVGDSGRYVPTTKSLAIAPVHLSDAPVFRKREIWPETSNPGNGTGTSLRELHHALRSYDSWPVRLIVHSPRWGDVEDYKKNRAEVFQLTESGQRDWEMLCYSNPKTLQTYLENIEKRVKGDPASRIDMVNDTITVSPNDAEISCHCADCRKLWDASAGAQGSASRIVASFTANLAREVQKRWPKLNVIQLAYLNYTTAPDGIEFPSNVQVQICGMPGMALYAQPKILEAEEANVRKWQKLTGGRKVQNWLYICWPEDRTKAVFCYPHAIQKYYRDMRDATVGSFINGQTDHWPRQHLTLYCWMKLLWNPDFNVDAAVDEYCRRMYGPASQTMRQLVQIQMDGWEKVEWPRARLTAKNVYTHSFPKASRERMKALLSEARKQAAGDALTLNRIDYYAQPFPDFFREGDEALSTQRTPLLVPHVDHEPAIDGKLDEAFWQSAPAVSLIRAYDREMKQPQYPTSLRAVWSERGVTFGWTLTDPAAAHLRRERTGRDHSTLWWDDCVEILFDVTGENAGDYYQFIVGAGGDIADSKAEDWAWNSRGIRTSSSVAGSTWTLEVFIPFDDFPEAVRPATGKRVTWQGNFTRHHVEDEAKKALDPACCDEYQRLNTTYAIPTANLADFGPIVFQD